MKKPRWCGRKSNKECKLKIGIEELCGGIIRDFFGSNVVLDVGPCPYYRKPKRKRKVKKCSS